MKNRYRIVGAIMLVFAGFVLSPLAEAVSPPPDGGYPDFTTAEGENALLSRTSGLANSAFGWFALSFVTDGSFNTAVGAGALDLNTASENTAVGTGALLLNTTGGGNTATGAFALIDNTTGGANTAIGGRALQDNTTGSFNTAVGVTDLILNTTGGGNTIVGAAAAVNNTTGSGNTSLGVNTLFSNVSGSQNTAVGVSAMGGNTIGTNNTAVGFDALQDNVIGGGNTAVGYQALQNATTSFNTALGNQAGSGVVNAHDVIAIGIAGADINDSCFIGNIRGVTTDLNDAIPVLIDSAGQLGTANSSQRFKKDIKPMESTSSAILNLNPVTFHYKTDKRNTQQFGLIAEEVAKVDPNLVVHDKDGQLLTVRYDAVNAMLLNEFLKEHKKVQTLEATVAQQQKGMEVLTAQLKEQAAQIQRVSAQLEVSKPETKVATGNQ